MEICNTIDAMRRLAVIVGCRQTFGLVPTMGALHEGTYRWCAQPKRSVTRLRRRSL